MRHAMGMLRQLEAHADHQELERLAQECWVSLHCWRQSVLRPHAATGACLSRRIGCLTSGQAGRSKAQLPLSLGRLETVTHLLYLAQLVAGAAHVLLGRSPLVQPFQAPFNAGSVAESTALAAVQQLVQQTFIDVPQHLQQLLV